MRLLACGKIKLLSVSYTNRNIAISTESSLKARVIGRHSSLELNSQIFFKTG